MLTWMTWNPRLKFLKETVALVPGLGWLGWAGAGQVYECKVVSNQSQGRDQGPYPDQARAAQSVCTHTGGTTHCRADGNSNPHLNYYCLGQRFILGSKEMGKPDDHVAMSSLEGIHA